MSQRNRPHDAISMKESEPLDDTSDKDECQEESTFVHQREENSPHSNEVIYHLKLEGLDVSYGIDHNSNVIVEQVSPFATLSNDRNCCNYLTWKDKLQ